MQSYKNALTEPALLKQFDSTLTHIQELNELRIEKIKRAFRLAEQVKDSALRVSLKARIYEVL